MRNSIERNVKKIVAGLLTGTLLLAGVCYLPVNNQKVYAAVAVDETVIHTEKLNIADYVGGAERIAPKPQKDGYEEWVFAGWYSDESCGKEYALKEETKIGEAYAKFVPSELLSVKCQTLLNSDRRENTQLRLVSTVDNLQYDNVGFDIRMGEKTFHYESKKVCKEIKVTETSNSQVEFGCTPTDFHPMAQWFTTVTIINISQDDYEKGIFINPFWTTLDGTRVYGVSRYARVEDSYLNIVNVPVRLYSDEQVAAGYLEVGYDKTKFTYAGYDTGTVFEEMEAAADGAGTVRLVGNVGDIKSNVSADGMYVNLRFQKVEGASLEETEIFVVSGEQFSDNLEILQNDMDVSNIVYKNLNY